MQNALWQRCCNDVVSCAKQSESTRAAQVESGKPAPDCFAAAAGRLGVLPGECLVVEDAPSGVQAATAAGMRVVLVPSIPKTEYPPPNPAAPTGALVFCLQSGSATRVFKCAGSGQGRGCRILMACHACSSATSAEKPKLADETASAGEEVLGSEYALQCCAHVLSRALRSVLMPYEALQSCPKCPAGVVEVLPSLLDFKPAAYGLPPFDDELAGAVVLDPPWRIKGTVVKGFGRGSKVCAARLAC